MNYTEKVIRQSNYWYNDGLRRANFRDLSGAIISLRRSLQYCRQNIQARNLLGLVYYGRGEINEALVEWIISKNLKPRDNIANYFIKKVQNSPRELDRLNHNIKKYNQCLAYCEQDAEDLAFIQIKKVVQSHPSFVKGYQLLALLSIQNGQYSKANQALKKAHRIDTTDAITLYYISELAELKSKGKRVTDGRTSSVTYRDGNETIIQPTSSTLKEDAGRITIMNIVIGVAIGVAVMAFLIQPQLTENTALKNADAIRDYSAQIDSLQAESSALSTELEAYRTTNDEAEVVIANATVLQDNYELLCAVEVLLKEEETSDEDLAQHLFEVDVTLLEEEGLALYEALAETIYIPLCESLYEEAVTAYEDLGPTETEDGETITYEAEDYEPIIANLVQVVGMYPDYEQYQAMLMLAEMYVNAEDWVNAQVYYSILASDSTDSEIVDTATEALETVDEKVALLENDVSEEDTSEEDASEE